MNPTQTPDRSARLNMRISPDALESIREAASCLLYTSDAADE